LNSGTHISVRRNPWPPESPEGVLVLDKSIDFDEIMNALDGSETTILEMPLGDVTLVWGLDINIVEDYDSNRFIDYAVESIQPLRKALAA
jgi:hypothetical protein